jgi:hypothetical protein
VRIGAKFEIDLKIYYQFLIYVYIF